MKCTVPAIMEVGENQMEVQMVMRRTNGRIPNLNKYLLQYWRANHDCTLLVDSAHKMRYATKYVSKGGQISVLLNEIIEHLEQKLASSVVAPTVKQAPTQFLLADCSNRTMMSKQELAYKVMDLPQIRRNFTQVKIVAHYPRAVVIEEAPHAENGVIELSDRTEYSAYSERCFPVTVTKGKLTKDELIGMNLSEFAENVGFKWIMNRKSDEPQCQNSSVHENNNEGECDDEDTERTSSRLKWRCRDRRSGYWSMWRKRSRAISNRVLCCTRIWLVITCRWMVYQDFSICRPTREINSNACIRKSCVMCRGKTVQTKRSCQMMLLQNWQLKALIRIRVAGTV
jgi:hypothetical protein